MAVLVLAIGGLALARVPGTEPVEGHPGLSEFRQQATVAQTSYDDGQLVEITFRVCRSRPWWNTTSGTGFQAVWRVVDEHGEVVADTSTRVEAPALSRFRWRPGQCRSVEYEWDQRYWNQPPPDVDERQEDGLPVRGDRVEPGTYRFEVWWDTSPGEEPDELTPYPTTTDTFELRP